MRQGDFPSGSFIGRLAKETFLLVFKAGEQKSFDDGQMIALAESRDARVIIVLAGEVGLSRLFPSGREIKVAEVGAGECFGEGTIFNHVPRAFNAQAVGQTRILELKEHEMLELTAQSSDFAIACVRNLCGHLERMTQYQSALIEQPMSQRLAGVLLRYAAQADGPLKVTQQKLSEKMRCSRLQVHRALQSMSDEGVVSLGYGAITIIDKAALTALATA